MGMARRPNAPDWGTIALTAFLAVVVIILLAMYSWAYLTAPGTYDLTARQRAAALQNALRSRGVVALRERGDMAILSREDITHVGSSRCIGEHECYRWEGFGRRMGWLPQRCGQLQTNLYCAYEIVDKESSAAAALVKTFRRDPDTPRSPPTGSTN